jgi:hypothetical protein
MKLDNPNA